ncbi:MAG TPA: phospholipid carrier-dependent glycosyltransferase [Thermoleophilaceae bacterium]|nr:phospholipid carrier-dependent glycosyltransferase [Thermoleophilaceae bacterium]
MDRVLQRRAAPYILLAVLVAASIGVRCFRLEQPCDHGCRNHAAASLIFDEAYYVNAARRIAGVPAAKDQPSYGKAPSGTDPNAEHPQLGKLVMAAGIEIFGNRPLGYRIGSVLAGTAVLLLMFALVRAAGGGPWLALGATAVLAADHLFTVHGRIATLDIYYLAFMLGGVALYLRRRPVLAGVVLGVGATTKLVGIYALFILGLLELGRWATRRRGEIEPLALCIVATGIAYAVVLQVLDMSFPAFDPGTGEQFHNFIAHTRHMLDYAAQLTSPGGPKGIASYPWSWLAGQGTIPYLTVNSTTSAGGQVVSTTTLVAFRGAVNPFLLYLATPALFAAAARAWSDGDDLDILALAWFLGTMVPFSLQAIFQDRTTYLYYLVATLPAICLACARLFSIRGVPRAAALGWGVALIVGFVNLYPFRTLF